MRTTNPFNDGAEDMAHEFQRLATERANEFDADEEESHADDPEQK